MKKIIFIGLWFLWIIILLLPVYWYTQTDVMIWNLEGKIFIPKENFGNKCFVYVHGDGPIDIDGFWFYRPYFNEFAKKWYCSLSWEKSKDYKLQSMNDRAKEVERAIKVLKETLEVEKIYVIWWSQSAWVLPYIDQKDINAFIQVSWAVDWISQSEYMTQTRADLEEWSSEKLSKEVQNDTIFDRQLSSGITYSDYKNTKDFSEVWERNWNFWQTNFTEDIRTTYPNIKIPYLAIFGGNDAHVDVEFSRKSYPKVLVNSYYQELYYKNANHSLIITSKKEFIHEWIAAIKNFMKSELFWIGAYPKDYFTEILEFSWRH